MSFQTPVENRTPFTTSTFVLPDGEGQEVLLLVMAAAFVAPTGTDLMLADEPPPIRVADQLGGDPAMSSTVYEADLALAKPFVDVLVNGHAYAPGERAIDRVAVRILVGDIDKTLVVTGDREPSGRTLPFTKMPIIYERALGGVDAKGIADLYNPVGVGYHGATSRNASVQTAAPNVEYPEGVTSLGPAGFGALGRGWKPRIDFAGTFDTEWLNERWPLLPADFDPRHYQAAPLDQQSRTLAGGESVGVLNMTPTGRWAFTLPRLDIPVHLIYENRYQRSRLQMDTVLLEPDNYRVTLTARVAVPTVRNAGVLRVIVVGHVTRAWLRARARKKIYVSHGGTDGTDLSHPTFYLR